MAIVQRPNQEALVRGLNIYRDTMRPFILTTLRGVHGFDISNVIKSSLNEEGAASFERDLERNGGNVDETLDVGHFRPIIENNWDVCFSVHFGYDRTVFGTLGWITGARNQASHPGTQDIDRNEVTSAFTNIIKVLNYIDATDSVRLMEDMRDQVSTMSQPAAPVERSETSTQTTASKCANRRCTSFNEHPMDQNGISSVVCSSCSTRYSTQTFVVVRYDRHYSGQEKTNNYSLRVRLPSGREDIYEIKHPENLQLNRNDRITISYDRNRVGTYLYNHDLNRCWPFGGGGCLLFSIGGFLIILIIVSVFMIFM